MPIGKSSLVSAETLNTIQDVVQEQKDHGGVFNYTVGLVWGRSVVTEDQKKRACENINDACKKIGLDKRQIEVLPDSEEALNKTPLYLCVRFEDMISNLADDHGNTEQLQQFIYDEILNATNKAGVIFTASEKKQILDYMLTEVVDRKAWGNNRDAVINCILQSIDIIEDEEQEHEQQQRERKRKSDHSKLNPQPKAAYVANDHVGSVLPSLPDNDPLSQEQLELLELMMDAPRNFGCQGIDKNGCEFLIKSGYVLKENMIEQPDVTMNHLKILWDDTVIRLQNEKAELSSPPRSSSPETKQQRQARELNPQTKAAYVANDLVGSILPSLQNNDPLSQEQSELLELMMEASRNYGYQNIDKYACEFLIKSGCVLKENLLENPKVTMKQLDEYWSDQVEKNQNSRAELSTLTRNIPPETKQQREISHSSEMPKGKPENAQPPSFDVQQAPPVFDKNLFIHKLRAIDLRRCMQAPQGLSHFECASRLLALLEKLYPELERELGLSPDEMVQCVNAGMITINDVSRMQGDIAQGQIYLLVNYFRNDGRSQKISRNVRLAASRNQVQSFFQQYAPYNELLNSPGDSHSVSCAVALQLGIPADQAQLQLANYVHRFRTGEDRSLDYYVQNKQCINLDRLDPNQVAKYSDIACHPSHQPDPDWLPVLARCYKRPVICQVLQNGSLHTYSVQSDGRWCSAPDILYGPDYKPLKLVYDPVNGHFDGYQDRESPVVNTRTAPLSAPHLRNSGTDTAAEASKPPRRAGVRLDAPTPPKFTVPLPLVQADVENVEVNEAQNQPLYFAVRQQGLVKDQNEFRRLFSKVPSGIYVEGALVRALGYFRDLQSYRPETEIDFFDEMFPALLFQDQLNAPPWQETAVSEEMKEMKKIAVESANLQGKTKIEIDEIIKNLEHAFGGDRKLEVCKNLHNTAQKYDNYYPEIIGTEKVRRVGIQPYQPGLLNFGNNCFMASTMALTAHVARDGVMLEELKHTVPVGVLVDYLGQYHRPSPAKGKLSDDDHAKLLNQHFLSVWDEAYALQANLNSAVINDNPKGIKDFVFAHRRLTNAFVVMCEELNNRQGDQHRLVQAQIEFFTLLKEYGDMTDKLSIKDVMGGVRGQKHTLSQIKQEDASDMVRVLATLVGSDVDPRGSVGIAKTQTLRVNDVACDKKVEKVIPGPLVAFPLAGNTLDECILELCADEVLDPQEENDWSEDRLKDLKITQWGKKERAEYGEFKDLHENRHRSAPEEMRYQELLEKGANRPPTRTSGQLKLYTQGGVRPKNFVLQSKLYKYTSREPVYLKDKGMNLLQRTPMEVMIPFHDSENPDAPPVNHKYRVSSIVCHKGDSMRSGHYITLKFDGDNVIVCDDDIVLPLDHYLAYRGQPPCRDWREFCRRERLSGYLYSVESA